ncbi:MAG: RluA family pseudouridine synthase [Myxococcota bacterium]
MADPTQSPVVLSADDDLVVVDKPSGWVVHAARQEESHDVLAWLTSQGHAGMAPLHRLDRGASGVVLFSAVPAIRKAIGAEFASGTVDKRYVALVHGRTHRKGIVRIPVDDQVAVTRYRLLEPLGGFSWLGVRPETGRKHQIRRHLHGLGHSIVGDDRYRIPGFIPVPAYPSRLCLHAQKLTLPDGRSFEAPVPEALQRCREALRG